MRGGTIGIQGIHNDIKSINGDGGQGGYGQRARESADETVRLTA